MRYREFERQAVPLFSKALEEFSFKHHEGPYFVRGRNSWQDVLFFDLERPSGDAFSVCVGIHVPMVRRRFSQILDVNVPTPDISSFLGRLGDGGKGSQRWYRFGRPISLSEAISKSIEDFRGEVPPWLASFQTIDDVAAEYRRRNIGDATNWERTRNAIPLAIYGFLLIEAGRRQDGRGWLKRAQEEVSKPLYELNGTFSTEKGTGAREVVRSRQERVLSQILEGELATGSVEE